MPVPLLVATNRRARARFGPPGQTAEPGVDLLFEASVAGGIPLMIDGKIIGAIGVSGGPNGAFDNAAAQAGVDALK